MMEKKEQNGYCPTCKKPQDTIALCDQCAGRRDDGKYPDDDNLKPPTVEQVPWNDERRK